MDEVWLQIEDHPDYAVSDHGRVKRIKAARGTTVGKILKPIIGDQGYMWVALSNKSQVKRRKIHILVCTAFHGKRPHKHESNHKDCIKTNNYATNLEWITSKDNKKHAWENGLYDKGRFSIKRKGESHHYSRLTNQDIMDIRYARNHGTTQEQLANKYNTSRQYISKIQRRIVWTHI